MSTIDASPIDITSSRNTDLDILDSLVSVEGNSNSSTIVAALCPRILITPPAIGRIRTIIEVTVLIFFRSDIVILPVVVGSIEFLAMVSSVGTF